MRDLLLRVFPHRLATGLIEIGSPGRDSPVLVTGNYTVTVRRMKRVLRGRDVHLLVADSRGINVWCAAGGGHLTDHDVVSVIRTSGIDELVEHRRLMLPQLAATGIERRHIADATGWDPRWGPAHLEDLPDVLDREGRVPAIDRLVRFGWRDRAEMATVWAWPMAVIGGAIAFAVGGVTLAVAVAATMTAVTAVAFVLVGRTPIVDRGRFVTLGVLAVAGFGAAYAAMSAATTVGVVDTAMLAVAALATSALLSVDLPGTTPWYPSAMAHDRFEIELLVEACRGAADCVSVCPRGVLRMNGPIRKVEIVDQASCIRCGACVVQCPEDALRFRRPDGRIVEPKTIRTTRLNLLGRRTIDVSR